MEFDWLKEYKQVLNNIDSELLRFYNEFEKLFESVLGDNENTYLPDIRLYNNGIHIVNGFRYINDCSFGLLFTLNDRGGIYREATFGIATGYYGSTSIINKYTSNTLEDTDEVILNYYERDAINAMIEFPKEFEELHGSKEEFYRNEMQQTIFNVTDVNDFMNEWEDFIISIIDKT